MKTMDLSYDFLTNCDDEYNEIKKTIQSISFKDETQALEFLQNFISESMKKYSQDELYLLNRLQNHLDALAQRYETGEDAKTVVFDAPTRSANPLLR